MLNFEGLVNGERVPPVHVEDLKAVWAMYQELDGLQAGVHVRLIAEKCAVGPSDPLAVFARTSLLRILIAGGEIEQAMCESMFLQAALFPLPNGIQGCDSGELLAGLKDSAKDGRR